MFAREPANDERWEESVLKGARSARRRAGLESIVPRSDMRRPAWST